MVRGVLIFISTERREEVPTMRRSWKTFLLFRVLGGFIVGLSLSLSFGQGISNNKSTVQPGQESTETVSLVVSVTNKAGTPFEALPQSAFSITSRNVLQNIVDFSQPDAPISTAIIFDMSGSMGSIRDGKALKRTRTAVDALIRFVRLSHPSNDYFLIGFNNKAHALWDHVQDADATIADLNKIKSLSFRNGAALYDALRLSIDKVSQGAYPKRVIILVTDGDDNSSQATFKETARLIEQTNVLVYPLLLLPDIPGDIWEGSSLDAETQSILKEFAGRSGGMYFQAKRNPELKIVMERIATELRHQYLISIHLTNAPVNKCHEFKIKLSPDFKSSSARVRKSLCL
jgi:VWFA-related protein